MIIQIRSSNSTDVISQNPLTKKKNDDGQKNTEKRRETDLEGNPF